MSKKLSFSVVLLIVFSMLLAACATATAVPPTVAPTVATVDWLTTWNDFLTAMPADYYRISPADLNTEIQAGKAPFIIDVREASEIQTSGYIKGAVNIPLRNLLQNLNELPALDQPIVVHCAIEHRGAMAMAALRLLGYTNVLSLDGGFVAWTNAKLPVVMGTPAAPVAGTAPNVDPTRLADLNTFLSKLPDNFDGMMDTDVLKAINSSTPPTIIDVRTPDEITAAGGSIAGSISIPFSSLLSDMTKLPADKTTPIITVSSDGQNGAVAAMALHMLGYTNVNSMFFGFNGWASDKLPIQK